MLTDELEAYTMTKSSLHFPVDRPLPKALVTKLIAVRLREIRVDMDIRLLAVLAHDLDDAGDIVNARDHVQADAADLSDRFGLVVNEVIRRVIALALPLLDGDTAALVRWLSEVGLILA